MSKSEKIHASSTASNSLTGAVIDSSDRSQRIQYTARYAGQLLSKTTQKPSNQIEIHIWWSYGPYHCNPINNNQHDTIPSTRWSMLSMWTYGPTILQFQTTQQPLMFSLILQVSQWMCHVPVWSDLSASLSETQAWALKVLAIQLIHWKPLKFRAICKTIFLRTAISAICN